MTTHRRLFIASLAAIVFLFTASLFTPSLSFKFLQWDDQYHLLNNPFIQPDSPEPYLHFWKHPYGKLYVPVTYSLWAFLYANSLSSGGPVAGELFHAVNLLIHAMNATLAFLIMLSLLPKAQQERPDLDTDAFLRSSVAAATAAIFFAVHPLQVESVAWISELRGLLSGMFCLASLLAYVVAIDTRPAIRRRIVYSLGVFAFAVAALCKPSAAALPGVMIVIDLLIKKRRWLAVALWILPWIAISAAEFRLMATLQPAPVQTTALWTRPFIAGDSAAFYMAKLLWPFALCADYSRTPENVRAAVWFWIAWIIPAGTLAFAVILRSRILLAAFLIFLAALAPTLGLVPFDFQRFSTVADRYAYLALLGPAWLIALALARWPRRETYAVAAILLIGLAARSIDQLSSWRDTNSLWTHAVAVNPRGAIATANLAEMHQDAHDPARASAMFGRVIELAPHRANGYLGMATLARDARDFVAAEKWYRDAMSADATSAIAPNDLGSLLAERHRLVEAEQLIRAAIAIESEYADGWSNLGAALIDLKRPQEAEQAFQRALAINPRHALASLGLTRAKQLFAPSFFDVDKLKSLVDDDMRRRDFAAAGAHLDELLHAAPDDLWGANTRAQWLATTGQFDRAIAAFEALIAKHPDLPQLQSNLQAARAMKDAAKRPR